MPMFAPRDSIYQLFVGRHPQANVVDHPGAVLARLKTFAWQKLKNRGITHVYLLGLWDNRGPIIVTQEEGVDLSNTSQRTPSIFAISNHTLVNPLLGTETELKELLSHLRDHDIKTIVDFVPNHTATNHPWVESHPDYYFQNESGLVTEFSGDVYKLDYENPQTCAAMQTVLMSIARAGVNGVRVDMAHLVPVSFWNTTIKQVRAEFPDFIFIAEAYSTSLFDTQVQQSLFRAGFDLVYHEALYRNMKKSGDDHEPLHYVLEHVRYYLEGNPLAWLNYVSNHDDPAPDGLHSWLALLLLLPSPLLLFNGVLSGMSKRLAHHTLELLPAEFDDFAQDVSPFDHFLTLRLQDHLVETLRLTDSAFELRLHKYQEPIHLKL